MTSDRNPFEMPEWHALRRETSLVNQLIGAGATALGRATYADGFGEYYTAFFGLSIGIERLAKLILIADYVIESNGKIPDQTVVRKYGHRLDNLLDEVDRIAIKNDLELSVISERDKKILIKRPSCEISAGIIRCLDAFADASKGRYANFEAIGNPSYNSAEEPVAKWWREVVELILDKHYRGRQSEAGVKERAKIIDALMSDWTMVRHFDEASGSMFDMRTASERTGQTKWAQKYGRFYTLTIVRWLVGIFVELTGRRGYSPGVEILFGHYEAMVSYYNDDSFLLTRKHWPLR